MFAYLLLLVAVLSRVLPHAGWWNFTAVGGALLFFGARRPWREMLAPLAALMTTDVCLNTLVYHDAFKLQWYAMTWIWYAAAMVLGAILLRRVTWVRGVVAALLGPTSFFVLSNFAVWTGSGMYPRSWSGLVACYAAAVPFYRNDLVSTSLVLGVALGVPALVRRMQSASTAEAVALRG